MYNLAVIVSSTRPRCVGAAVGSWAARWLESDWNVTILDLAEINLPFLDEEHSPSTGIHTRPHTLAWKAAIDDADAIIVVTPEYNGFFTAPLKNAVDYLRGEWEAKPMGIVGYGWHGARRAVAALTQLLGNLKADVVGSVSLTFETDLSSDGHMTAGVAKESELGDLSEDLAHTVEHRSLVA